MSETDHRGTNQRGADPRGDDEQAWYLWQGVGVVGVIGVAIILFVATLWLAEGTGSPSQAGTSAVARRAAPAAATATLELPAVPLTEHVSPVPGVVFGVGGLRSVGVDDPAPGEVGAPALRVAVTLRNDTDTTVSLGSTVVNVYAGTHQLPMPGLSESAGAPLPEQVAPGATATGVFLFAVPVEDRSSVKIAVDYAAGVPRVVFAGAAPR
ncbi:hypothetical protein E3O42_00210 [Cryobacterium adonitolivorans]|uniref:DUF4352 domain-containing protein n=1 Tax=Cryobacterium adonitolivorans TaxID=1259189 RepID=A0A4R8WDT5_9MICO|nr:hypothetical protein [Cryobacterium adonitolivorans]TFC07205.1 hypothetical protein E3O42_00210 [Cryobacterium adonitolivorans]